MLSGGLTTNDTFETFVEFPIKKATMSLFGQKLGNDDSSQPKGAEFYHLLKPYVLSMDRQKKDGYPRPDPYQTGRALISGVYRCRRKLPRGHALPPDERSCDRCGTLFRVDSLGFPLSNVNICKYHNGKKSYPLYMCCNRSITSGGCTVASYHVADAGSMEFQCSGYVQTAEKSPSADGDYGVYALDCEMCYTKEGPELTRVTVVSPDKRVVYETLVKPNNPIIDYNTSFSGISERDMACVKTSIRDVQNDLLGLFSNNTILIGHSLDNDLRALKIIHDTVIDTSIAFPHRKGLPYRNSLHTLCTDYLHRDIQKNGTGHDSAEDAIACMELMIYKVKRNLKI